MDTELVQSIIDLLDEYKNRCSDVKKTIESMEQSLFAAKGLLTAYKAAEEAKHGPKRD